MSLTQTRLAHVVAFANGKGGVGKTTLSTNVAGLMAARGKRTLLIEFDPQGDCGLDLGYAYDDRGDHGEHLLAALSGREQLHPVLHEVRPRLDVIPMGRNAMMGIDDLLRSKVHDGLPFRHLLANALAPLADQYDLVIIDTPPFAPLIVQLVFSASRWLIVPTRGDNASILGLRELAAEIEESKPSNPYLELLGIVLFDMDTSATRIRREAETSVSEVLGVSSDRLFDHTVRHSVAAMDARGQGCLVHELAKMAQDEQPHWFEALRAGVKTSRIPSSVASLAEDFQSIVDTILVRMDASSGAPIASTEPVA